MTSEKTPLTTPTAGVDGVAAPTTYAAAPTNLQPFYVQQDRYHYYYYTRRRRERQLQFIMFLTVISAFILALIISISYSVNRNVIPNVNNSAGVVLENASRSPNLTLLAAGPPLVVADNLTPDELNAALEAGNLAIAARHRADAASPPLPSPSPDSRHMRAVSTSPRADEIALAGVAEIAATKRLAGVRSFMGQTPKMGSYLDGGWAPPDTCFTDDTVRCLGFPSKYRTFDGICNRKDGKGAAFTPLQRGLPPMYADGVNAPRVAKNGEALPSARAVSMQVHKPSPSSDPQFTVMLAVFGQFLDHDITATAISRGANGSSLSCCPPNGDHPECFPVLVSVGDPVYDQVGTSCMEFVRSAPAAQCRIGPRQQLNQVTAFIDGSTVYGADVDTADSLREFAGGRLRMQVTPDNRTLLPASTNPNDGCNRVLELARGRYCFASGDARANENLHLTTMHLLWARQHNRLSQTLGKINPGWDDETVFQEARRIVGAQMQHIAYREFLPIVLGDKEMAARNMTPLPTGYRYQNISGSDPSIRNEFASSAFRFAHTLIPGLMKVTDAQKGTSSYVQLHKMLFNPYSLYTEGGIESSITSATSNVIQKTSTHVTSQLTAHLFEDPLSNKTIECGLDLVSLNIQRGRDHGLAGYPYWREYCGLKRPKTFDDLKDDLDPQALENIATLYNDVDDVDLYTGALAEIPQGDGIVGPTFTCLIADQFQRIQGGDKFWYEAPNQPGSFTEAQLKEIRKTTLARVICDTSDSITETQAQVMRSIGADNPVVSCEDLPDLTLEPWKEDVAILDESETVVPYGDWLRFKNQVNSTIDAIVAAIMNKLPQTGDPNDEWGAFQRDATADWAEFRRQFDTLQPRAFMVPLEKLDGQGRLKINWDVINDDLNKTVASVIEDFKNQKPPQDSPPEVWIAYDQNLHKAIAEIKNRIGPAPQITPQGQLKINWDVINDDLNQTIAQLIEDFKAQKPPQDSPPEVWIAYDQNLQAAIQELKNKFQVVPRITPPVQLLKINWDVIQDDFNQTLAAVIENFKAQKPPQDSPPEVWIAYDQNLQAAIAEIKRKFSVVPRITPPTQLLKINWDAINSDLNQTIAEVIENFKAQKPPQDSPPEIWIAYDQNLHKAVAEMKNKIITNRAALNLPKLAMNWDAINRDLNRTVDGIMEKLEMKKPRPGSPPEDWIMYEKSLNKSLENMKARYHIAPKLEQVGMPGDIDWTKVKTNVNNTFWSAVKSVNESTRNFINGLPEDWEVVKGKFSEVMTDIKNVFSGDDEPMEKLTDKNNGAASKELEFKDLDKKRPHDVSYGYLYPKVVVSSPLKNLRLNEPFGNLNIDWDQFCQGLNKSLADLQAKISARKPTAQSAPSDWLNYKNSIQTSVKNVENQFIKIYMSRNDPAVQQNSSAFIEDRNFDWVAYKAEVQGKIDAIRSEIGTIQAPNAVLWSSFKADIDETLVRLWMEVDQFNPSHPLPKILMVMNDDLSEFRGKVNEALEQALKDIQTNKLTTTEPDFVRQRLMQLKSDLNAEQDYWMHKVKTATNMMRVTDLPNGETSSAVRTRSYFYTSLALVGLGAFVERLAIGSAVFFV